MATLYTQQSKNIRPIWIWVIVCFAVVAVVIIGNGANFYGYSRLDKIKDLPRGVTMPAVKKVLSGVAGSYDSFSKCLAQKGAVMYGAEWCPDCQNEKNSFGNSFQYIPYVECPANQGKCDALNIVGYPTWIFGGEKRLVGEQGLKKLSQESGCELKKDAPVNMPSPSPTIKPPAANTGTRARLIYPNGGEVVGFQKFVTVQWLAPMNISAKLYRIQVSFHKVGDTGYVYEITNTPNDGIETFTLPSWFAPGKYKAKVAVICNLEMVKKAAKGDVCDGNNYDYSDAMFDIVSATSPPVSAGF